MIKKFLRAFALLAVPFLASIFIRIIYATNKKKFYSPETIPDESTIFACWHGELLMLPYAYQKYRKTPHAKVLISSHFDGLLISKTITYFGLGTIAGSTNRNAAKVLIQAIKALKDGYDIGITPDGPKGPRHKVADGMIVMAQKTSKKIVLVRIIASKYWQLNSWDRFMIPKPFGTISYYMTQPMAMEDLGLEEARDMIENRLNNYEKTDK
ncbi:lysophospholipid acyltransferase family protein [Sulfurimonas sp.]|uniref:lysophospholipid acyltransferase family protein n=1 Tax=Sulfurimonas sp. TaxID=2022749 RepID=UPI0025FB453E|nr:lysophospholipid acyltransferase family protein [Sulfurimonas sp.]